MGRLESKALPPFPAVVDALLRLALDENVGLAQVSEVIATDAAVSVEVLRVVNTGFIGVRGEVSSVPQAAAILGLRRISAIAGAVALRASLGRWWRVAQVRRCWHHNLASALSAEHIARLLFRDADTAHTAGLLHDVGRFVLVMQFGNAYVHLLQSTVPSDGDLRERERALFGMDHSEAGRLLLEQLGLPRSMADVAAAHHDNPTDEGTQMVHVVRAACRFATAIGFGLHDDHLVDTLHAVPDADRLDALLVGLPPAYRAEVARQSEGIRNVVVELVSAYDRALI